MYFPSDMNFQYFFFSTYIGDFLQMIPIALLTCVGFTIYKKWREPSRPLWSAVLMSLFPAYLFSLIGLTLFSRMIGDASSALAGGRRGLPVAFPDLRL